MEQETLEEAAERIYREYPNNPLDKPDWRYNRDVNCFKKRKAFIAGAKWQAEQDKNKFSEEEVLDLLHRRSFHLTHKKDTKTTKEWFEQFKKK
jgi:hypothetical protein